MGKLNEGITLTINETVGRDKEGESNAISSGGALASLPFAIIPYAPVAIAGEVVVGIAFGLGHEASDGTLTARDWVQLSGNLTGTLVGGVLGSPLPYFGTGVGAWQGGKRGEELFGRFYDEFTDGLPNGPLPQTFQEDWMMPTESGSSNGNNGSAGSGNGSNNLPNTPRPSTPSDTAIQSSRDIVAGKIIDTSTGKPVYADAIIRLVAAAKTKREQAIAAAKADRDRQGGGGGYARHGANCNKRPELTVAA